MNWSGLASTCTVAMSTFHVPSMPPAAVAVEAWLSSGAFWQAANEISDAAAMAAAIVFRMCHTPCCSAEMADHYPARLDALIVAAGSAGGELITFDLDKQ
jgi:hypothetical protein